MNDLHINFFKWDKDYKIFYESCKKILGIKEPQIYFPILSLYIYYHNTKKSHKVKLTKIFNKVIF